MKKSPSDQAQKWRVFFQGKLEQGELVTLDENEHHYVRNVLRLQQGNQLEVSNPDGVVALACIDHSDKKTTALLIQEKFSHQSTKKLQTLPVDLIIGMSKPGALEECVQWAAELGARRVIFFKGERSHVKSSPRLDKLSRQALECTRISKASQPLKVEWAESLAESLNSPASLLFFCHEVLDPEGSITFQELLRKRIRESQKKAGNETVPILQIVVGPESSFSESEVALLLQQRATPVSLGGLILRVPAAVGMALAIALDALRSASALPSNDSVQLSAHLPEEKPL